MLANEWDDLPLCDFGVPAWETEDVSGGLEQKEVQEDDFDEEKDHIEVRCKRGDVWQLGEHRLMCGDSVSLEDVKKLMGGAIADIAFSSPPYNTGGIGKNLTKDNGRSKYNDNADDMSEGEYTAFLNGYVNNASQNSRYNFVNIQWLANNKRSIVSMMKDNMSRLGDILIWDKTRSQPAAAENVLNSEYELIFCFHDKGNRAIGTIPFHGTKKNIVHIPPTRNEYSDIHNAVFPMELPAHFIETFAKESVLDLFGGTGTTLIAAEQLGRKAYLMELDPTYCDVIIARWEKFTGKQATKIN
jgi:DNA modification methylase